MKLKHGIRGIKLYPTGILFFLIPLALTASTNACRLTKRKPQLLLEQTLLNLDTIRMYDTVRFNIPVKNTGTANLVIRKVSSSCGCTVSKMKSDCIAPGLQTEIMGTIVPADTGSFDKSVVVKANTVDEYYVINIKGFVKK